MSGNTRNFTDFVLWNLLIVIPSFRFFQKFSDIKYLVLYALSMNLVLLFLLRGKYCSV